MRAVFLAAGYGTRLDRDLQDDESGQYSHLVGTPKPLLPVGGLPLVTHWIRAFDQVPKITSVVVVVNDLHKPRDTLLPKDFSLNTLVDKFESLRAHDEKACVVLSAPVAEENVSKHGIIEVGEGDRVINFLEKPDPQDTTSRLQCPCVYLMSSGSLQHLKDFLEETRTKPLSCRDAPGLFVGVLIQRAPVFAHHVTHRYDVGGLLSYLECCRDFLQA
ncbi:uncharacterized protein LOC127002685 isoform X4 [Eriocheir sinensis]|uniref:uncharacterized protein LOC127002685 isoform X4 n=1 Tax=Eriocheir sinensis TaxID=95602 RepID=UPI0021C9B403|nr:uncharacterized protein LOC127002685 isoform X4 [Eriocheir sinensis]